MKRLHGRILRWGNSYGIRISKAEAERLGLHAGQDISFLLPKEDTSPPLPAFDLGGQAVAEHDEWFEEAAGRDLDEGR